MPRVTFTANLQRHLDVPSLEVGGARVGEVLTAVFERHPLLRSYIVDDQGRLRRHVNVFVNSAMVAEEMSPSNAACGHAARNRAIASSRAVSGVAAPRITIRATGHSVASSSHSSSS